MASRITQKAFTLIEVIIAVAIFAIISAVMSTVLYVMLGAQENAQDTAERLSEIQVAMSLIERDIGQLAARNDKQAPLIAAADRLEFIMHGNLNPGYLENRSDLARITYEVRDNNLYRISVGTDTMAKPQQRLLIKNITSIKFNYLNADNRWSDRWGRFMMMFLSDSSLRLLPKAISVEMVLSDWGEFKLICLTGHSENRV